MYMDVIKNLQQAEEELASINPALINIYKIIQHFDGVQLLRGDTSIVSSEYIRGCEDGLVEIWPKVRNKEFTELFDTATDYIVMPLKDAVIIAEYASAAQRNKSRLPRLKQLAHEYFGHVVRD